MVKKLVLGALLVGLIAILVAGAVIRTLDKAGNGAEARGQGQGHGASGQGALETGAGGYGGEGNSDAPGDSAGAGQAQVGEWLTLSGTVVSVDADALVVQTAEGEVVVENRPWWFAQELSFSAQVGDQVILTGFYEDGVFEAGQIDDTTTGQTVRLRDENGRPGWAGRGRRGG